MGEGGVGHGGEGGELGAEEEGGATQGVLGRRGAEVCQGAEVQLCRESEVQSLQCAKVQTSRTEAEEEWSWGRAGDRRGDLASTWG